jgi:hypothetical protein
LQAIRVGLSFFCALAIAAAMASVSWPSTARVAQLAASNRLIWFSEVESEVGPSIEIELSSHSTISFFSCRCPRGNRFLADALHQAAIAGDHVGEVVDELVAERGVQDPLGQCEADRIGEALTQRTGGCLDPRSVAVFRMAGGLRSKLAEALQSSSVMSA